MSAANDEDDRVDTNVSSEQVFAEDAGFSQNEGFSSEEQNFNKDEAYKQEDRFQHPNSGRPMRAMRGMPFMRPGMGPNRTGPPFDAYGAPPMGMPRGPPRHMQHYQHRYPPMNESHDEDTDDSLQNFNEINAQCGEFDVPPPNSSGYQTAPPGMRPRAPPPFMMGPHGGPHPPGLPHGGPQLPGPPGPPPYGPPSFGGHGQPMSTSNSAPYTAAGPTYGSSNAGRPFAGPPGSMYTGPPAAPNCPPTSSYNNQNFGNPPPVPGMGMPPGAQDFSSPHSNFNQSTHTFNGPHFPGQTRPNFGGLAGMPPPTAASPSTHPIPPSNVPHTGPPVPPPGMQSPGMVPATPPVAQGANAKSAPGTLAGPPMPTLQPGPTFSQQSDGPAGPAFPSPSNLPFASPRPPYSAPSGSLPTSTSATVTNPSATPTSTSALLPPLCPPPAPHPPVTTASSGYTFTGSTEGAQFSVPPSFPPSGNIVRPMIGQPAIPPQPSIPFHIMPPPMPTVPVVAPSMPPFQPPIPFMPPIANTLPPLAQPPVQLKTGEDIWVENLTAEGKPYYYNMRTRETRWDKPEGVTIVRQGEVEGTSKPVVSQSTSSAPSATSLLKPPEVALWTEYRNPEGKAYYHNSKSGETTWEKPKVLLEWEESHGTSANSQVPLGSTTAKAPSTAVVQPTSLTDDQPPKASISNPEALSGQVAAESKADVEKRAPVEKPEASTEDSNETKNGQSKVQKDSSRPVSSTAVPGTPWCVVWTGDDRAFFFNPSQRLSVWEKPEELKGRADVDRLLEKRPGNANTLSNEVKTNEEVKSETGETSPKKPRLEDNEHTINPDNGTDVLNNGTTDITDVEMEKTASVPDKIPVGLEAAREAEERAARERAVQPLEVRVRRFREMLVEMQVSAFSTWEKELHKIVFDPRYLLLASKERKQTFEAYVKERADEERREKKNKLKERKEKFVELLEEASLSSKSSFSDFAAKYAKDERFKNIEKARERESFFQEFLSDLRKREKDEKHKEKEKVKSDFLALLKEQKHISRHSHWSEVKRKIDSDPRYKSVDSSSKREDWFRDYIRKLDENPPSRENSESRKEREKKERQEASLREREREVKEALSSSLREREKEREQQMHIEQEQNFRTMLTESIRDPNISWKEAKKILRKDDRWELVSDVLQRAERDELFKNHLSNLMRKSRDLKPSSESDNKEKRHSMDDDRRDEYAHENDRKYAALAKDSSRR
ncbi:unnamed protein product [Dicrocoelium dendriticum]|nr:unnamed protein product [Dicrocoelium dendriticum]CAH8542681.1 unnamed protein product [Dicrocoelium dendriticum]